VNLIRPLQLLFVVAAIAVIAPAAQAGSRCTDDPERCVERGASVSRPAARTLAPAPAVITAQPVLHVPARKATVSKKSPKVARVTPNAGTTPAPTPGMGMLLKLSTATGGDVTWSPGGRSQDNTATTGASWIL
jgi:hypothetical protein